MSTADKTTSRVSQQSGKSMATVYQQSPKLGGTPGQRHLHLQSGNVRSEHRFDHMGRFPRLRRDCCETNVRPLGDSILRIRHEMLDKETRQRTRSERMPEPLLTLKEAADYLRLTPAALYTQRHRGDRPGALGIRVGRKILYRPSDISRYLDELLAENQVSFHR